MPRNFDYSYHKVLAVPNYYSDDQERDYLEKKFKQAVIEESIPPLPTRETELKYLDFLEKDLRSDPWITNRFHAISANPHRIPYK